MKNIFRVLLVALIISSCASKTTFHNFYKENKSRASMSISTPSFIANILIPKEDRRDLEDLFRNVNHYRIMIFSDPSESVDKKFSRFISNKDYTSIFRLYDNGDRVNFYFLKRDKLIKELVLKVDDGDSSVIIGLKTHLTEDEFNGLIEKADHQGSVSSGR